MNKIYTVSSHVQISKTMFLRFSRFEWQLSCYSALFESVPAAPTDDALSVSSDDAESESGARSPCSPGIGGPTLNLLEPSLWSHYTLAPCASLLGKMQLVFCTADWCIHKLRQINNAAGKLAKNIRVNWGALSFVKKMSFVFLHYLLNGIISYPFAHLISKTNECMWWSLVWEFALKIIGQISFWSVFISKTAPCKTNLHKMYIPLNCVTYLKHFLIWCIFN